MNPGPPLSTPRRRPRLIAAGAKVALRTISPQDLDEYVALRAASRAHLEPWEPTPPQGFDPFGQDAFDRDLAHARTDTERRLLILRAQDGVIAGRLAIGGIERGPLQSARLGYWLGAPFVGLGYMSEALRLGLAHAFIDLGLHRVECAIIPRNRPSAHAAIAAGFRLEGRSPRYLQIAGVWEDHDRYALTIEDWQRQTGTTPRD